MTLQEYQQQAKRTCASLGSIELDLSHMILGIASEEEELLKAIDNHDTLNIAEEIADKYWYLANYCTFRDYNLQNLHDDKSSFETETWERMNDLESIYFSKLSDYVKKFVAYKKPIKTDEEINTLKVLLFSYSLLLSQFGLKLNKILENNINKLKVRFPEKFTEENALNRDLESERKELEK